MPTPQKNTTGTHIQIHQTSLQITKHLLQLFWIILSQLEENSNAHPQSSLAIKTLLHCHNVQRINYCIISVTSNNLQNKVHFSHSTKGRTNSALFIYSVVENIIQIKLYCILYDIKKILLWHFPSSHSCLIIKTAQLEQSAVGLCCNC